MIAIEHLDKSYAEKPVLRDLTLTFRGPIILMGPSGCGKTTLLRILMGLEKADRGFVTGVGTVGAVFQTDRLCPQLSAVENLCLTGKGLRAPKAAEELQVFGFTDAALLRQPARYLSGGQKRRVELLRALLCQDAQTLLLDEPFTGMEKPLVAQAAKTILRLTNGRDTVLVTHDDASVRLLGWPVYTLPQNS